MVAMILLCKSAVEVFGGDPYDFKLLLLPLLQLERKTHPLLDEAAMVHLQLLRLPVQIFQVSLQVDAVVVVDASLPPPKALKLAFRLEGVPPGSQLQCFAIHDRRQFHAFELSDGLLFFEGQVFARRVAVKAEEFYVVFILQPRPEALVVDGGVLQLEKGLLEEMA